MSLAALGLVATLWVWGTLWANTGWRGWGHLAMLYFILQAVGATALALKGRAAAGALFVLSGLGYFFAFMLSYPNEAQVLGTVYPLALFSGTWWVVAGLWVGGPNGEPPGGP